MCVAGKGHPPSALPGLVEGREEGSGQRQEQINLSHLLGGDPEEEPLHRLKVEPSRKLTDTEKHYLHFP